MKLVAKNRYGGKIFCNEDGQAYIAPYDGAKLAPVDLMACYANQAEQAKYRTGDLLPDSQVVVTPELVAEFEKLRYLPV